MISLGVIIIKQFWVICWDWFYFYVIQIFQYCMWIGAHNYQKLLTRIISSDSDQCSNQLKLDLIPVWSIFPANWGRCMTFWCLAEWFWAISEPIAEIWLPMGWRIWTMFEATRTWHNLTAGERFMRIGTQ